MPFLSRVRINPMRRRGRDVLTNPHIAHGMIVHGIPGHPVTERVLWRVEPRAAGHPELLILTETKPDWTHIVEQAGWPYADGEHFAIRDYQPLLDKLAIGREFAFRLRANPVQNTGTPDKPTEAQLRRRAAGRTRGFVLGHRTAVHQLDWLLRRTKQRGFEIPLARVDAPAPGLGDPGVPGPDVRITARDALRFRKTSGQHPVVLTVATYEGRLVVTDPDLLRHALLAGIGRAKAYGCGLLTLAPLPGHRHG